MYPVIPVVHRSLHLSHGHTGMSLGLSLYPAAVYSLLLFHVFMSVSFLLFCSIWTSLYHLLRLEDRGVYRQLMYVKISLP